MNNRKTGYYTIAAIVVFACYTGVSRADVPQTILYYTSSPSSWVGLGETRTVYPAGFSIDVMRYFDANSRTNGIDFYLLSSTAWYQLDFVGPNHTLATVGTYTNVARFPFQDNNPGLSFVANGHGDDQVTGQFQVLEATFDSSGNVQSYAANFTQYDEGNPAAWNQGYWRYNSTIPVPEPSTFALAALGAVGLLAARRRFTH